MATERDRQTAGVMLALQVAATKFLVTVVGRAFPWMKECSVVTHGMIFFVVSFVAPPALQLEAWKRWAILAVVSVGTLVELFVRRPATPVVSAPVALLLVSALVAGTMALEGWRADRMSSSGGGESS